MTECASDILVNFYGNIVLINAVLSRNIIPVLTEFYQQTLKRQTSKDVRPWSHIICNLFSCLKSVEIVILCPCLKQQ